MCSHSYGEFVFDHSWADAYYSYGSQYYPKLQCCVPFTPVTSQRILLRDTWYKDQVFFKLLEAMKDLTAKVSHEPSYHSRIIISSPCTAVGSSLDFTKMGKIFVGKCG